MTDLNFSGVSDQYFWGMDPKSKKKSSCLKIIYFGFSFTNKTRNRIMFLNIRTILLVRAGTQTCTALHLASKNVFDSNI